MTPSVDRLPIIRLWSVAGSCSGMLEQLNCRDTSALVERVQQAVGADFRVTADPELIEAGENDFRGGRDDDDARAQEINATFANDQICAAVALRGGAWLTRVLPRIDFNVLRRRTNRLALFGFSELTPLINIAGRFPKVIAYHDLCPAFIFAGLMDLANSDLPFPPRDRLTARVPTQTDTSDCVIPAHAGIQESVIGIPASTAVTDITQDCPPDSDAAEQARTTWAMARFRDEFSLFFQDMTRMLRGQPSRREVHARLVNPSQMPGDRCRLVGGNLTTLITLLGSPFRRALQPTRRWLLIEDIREKPERIDRMLAHLTLAEWLKRYDGIVVGQFHRFGTDCTSATLELLARHLGRDGPPIMVSGDIGHVWPLSPVPLHRWFTWNPTGNAGVFQADFPWKSWRVIPVRDATFGVAHQQ